MPEYSIRPVSVDVVLSLRGPLLDPEHPEPAAATPGDEHAAARHFGAYREDALVGVASIHPQGMPRGFQEGAWRLTGVAVEHGHRGCGVGAHLAEAALRHAEEMGSKIVWCLAPTGAKGFFARCGFESAGDEAEGDAEGPHLLFARVGPLRRSWALPPASLDEARDRPSGA